ncbi:MAG: hypothetical protein Q7R57_01045 [Dehalococcoidales bacterium]|nr:hypothetical protein [Dehalococcoidales bacterium]
MVTPQMSSFTQDSLGYRARRLRISQMLTRRELAGMAGVSLNEVNLLECNLPVTLDAKRKLLKELWARKLARN